MATLGRWAYRDWALGLVDRLSCLGNFWAIWKQFLRLVSSVCVFSFLPGEGGGGPLGIFWVGVCRPGLQIGTPF